MFFSEVKLPVHTAGLPGDVNTIRESALTPVLESVAAQPAYPAGAGRGKFRPFERHDFGLNLSAFLGIVEAKKIL